MLLIILELLDLRLYVDYLFVRFLVLVQLLVQSLKTLPLNRKVSRGPTRAFDSVPFVIELILDLVETLEVEKDVDDLPTIVKSLFDQSLEILLRDNAARNDLVVRYSSEQPFNLGRHIVDGVRERLGRPVRLHLDEGRPVRPGLVDLPDYAIPVFADVEFEADLCFSVSVADDVIVARHLAWPNHPAEERVEDFIEDRGLAALVQTCDENNPLRQLERFGKLQFLEVLRLKTY